MKALAVRQMRTQGQWTNSHHAAEHDLNFSFDEKTNKKKVKFLGQVNLGEGLAPRCNLWLAKVRTLSCKPKNCFRQQRCKLRKQFGRRFNNIDAWLKKCKCCFNRLKSIKTNAEPPQLANGQGKFPASTQGNGSSNVFTMSPKT